MEILSQQSHESLNAILLLLTPAEVNGIKTALKKLADDPNILCHMENQIQDREISIGILPPAEECLQKESIKLRIDDE